MKYINLIVINIFLTVLGVLAQPTISWDKSYGGTRWDGVESYIPMIATKDRGYVICSATNSNDMFVRGNHVWSNGITYRSDFLVIKIDQNGDTLWTKTLGGSDFDRPNQVYETCDGHILVVGYTSSPNDGDVTGWHTAYSGLTAKKDFWVVKLTSNGQLVWAKAFGGTQDDVAKSVIETSDGNYVVCGWTRSFDGDIHGYNGSSTNAGWVVKLTPQGDTVYTKIIIETPFSSNYLSSIIETCDDKLIVAGKTGSDGWLIKLDQDANVISSNTYGGTRGDFINSVIQASDGNLVLVGSTLSDDGDINGWEPGFNCCGTPLNDIWVAKIDYISGNVIWSEAFGGDETDWGYTVNEMSDGGYVIGTTSYSDISGEKTVANPSKESLWVLRLDVNGTLLWEKTIGGISGNPKTDDEACNVIPTFDGGYLVAGYSGGLAGNGDKTSPNLGDVDIWILKLEDTLNYASDSLKAKFWADTICLGETNTFYNQTFFDVPGCLKHMYMEWDFGDGTSYNITDSFPSVMSHVYLSVDTYNVKLITRINCLIDTFENQVIVNALPEIDITRDSVLCKDSIELTAICNEAYSNYVWSTGEIDSQITVNGTGYYNVIVSNPFGCANSDTILLTQYIPVSNIYYSEFSICTNENVVLKNNNPIIPLSYTWISDGNILNLDSLEPKITIEGSISYIRIDSNEICKRDSNYYNIISLNCNLNTYIPNVFSPNGDEQNDLFIVRIDNIIEKFQLNIYDRWGTLVFESKDQNIAWSGQQNGKFANEGVYIYVITGSFTDGADINLKGNVTLVR